MLSSQGREDTTGNTKVGVCRELWPTPQKLIREKDLDGNNNGGILEALQSKKPPLQRILSRVPRHYSRPPSSQNLPVRETIFFPYTWRCTLGEPYYFVNVVVHDYCPHPQQPSGSVSWAQQNDCRLSIHFSLLSEEHIQTAASKQVNIIIIRKWK